METGYIFVSLAESVKLLEVGERLSDLKHLDSLIRQFHDNRQSTQHNHIQKRIHTSTLRWNQTDSCRARPNAGTSSQVLGHQHVTIPTYTPQHNYKHSLKIRISSISSNNRISNPSQRAISTGSETGIFWDLILSDQNFKSLSVPSLRSVTENEPSPVFHTMLSAESPATWRRLIPHGWWKWARACRWLFVASRETVVCANKRWPVCVSHVTYVFVSDVCVCVTCFALRWGICRG